MQSTLFKQQAGFTLVELLTVMLILVAMASVTIETASELAFQSRYEVTKDRYQKIKRAIIGRPDVLINGQPDMSGFVADMGRLPANIHELLEQNYCVADRTKLTSTDCGGSWKAQAAGWSGPYLVITKDPQDANAFSDGWGNEATGDTDHNYGWTFNPTTSLALQSTGCGGGCKTTEYNNAYPATAVALIETDWKADVSSGITVNITPPNNAYCNDSVCDNPDYGTARCETTKKATWIEGNCIDAGGNLLGHLEAVCDPSMWNDVIPDACSESYYTDEVSCTANVGTLVPATCSGAGSDKATCEAIPAKWSSPAGEFNCKKGGGLWKSSLQDICIRINYEADVAYEQVSIKENGLLQSFTFSSFSRLSNDSLISLIPQGYYDAGIYTYDATATPKCTSTRYVSGQAIKIYLMPNTSLPTLNW